MIEIVWEFIVQPEALERFARSYGPAGEWARLFARHAGYRGSTLLRDSLDARRFLTIDRWQTPQDYSRMRAASGPEYSALDDRFAEWTESERALGVFESEPTHEE
jgi:hypothetical protein